MPHSIRHWDDPVRTQWFCSSIHAMCVTELLFITVVVFRTKFSPVKLVNRLTMVPFYSLLAFLFFLMVQQIIITTQIQFGTKLELVTELIKSIKAIAVYLVASSQTLEWLCLC